MMNDETYLEIEKRLRRDPDVSWDSPEGLDDLVRIYMGELTREQESNPEAIGDSG